MAATFDPTLPTERDHLRFLLGDTDVPDGALLQDETYDATLDQHGDWRIAGAELATGLASQYALEPDSVSISGDVSVSWRHRIENWTGLAAAWRAEVATEAGASVVSVAAVRIDEDGNEYTYEGVPPLYAPWWIGADR